MSDSRGEGSNHPGSNSEVSALDAAKIRFIGALPQKAELLKQEIEQLGQNPSSTEPLSAVRRQLHALYASAQVFQLDYLVQTLKKSIGVLDEVSLHNHPLEQQAMATLDELVGSLDQFPTMFPTAESQHAFYPPLGSLRQQPVDVRREEKNSETLSVDAETLQVDVGVDQEDSADLQKLLWPLEMANRVLHVMVVNDAEAQASIAALLTSERVQTQLIQGAENALRKAHSGAVDVVLVPQDFILERDPEWIDRLHSDTWTNPISVVVLVQKGSTIDPALSSNTQIAGFLTQPFELQKLVDTLTYAIGTIARSTPPPEPSMGASTLDDVTNRLSEEIRQGLMGDARKGEQEKIELGDGEEILHATWNAIQQVRQVIAEKSEGKVQFEPTEKHGSSLFPSPNDSLTSPHAPSSKNALENRNIFVVDDDASVVWVLAGLLRAEGAEVHEFNDAREALQAAQHEPPDLILCDIVMPEFDGFALCRALQKDPILNEVPTILLSWKEDYLQRMRDLKSGAAGYVRKEEGNEQILAEVRKVLQPISRLEVQLKTEIEVRGQIEDIGILTLLRTVVEQRPSAHVAIRDAWNLFEIVFKDGTIADFNRTSSDGNFAHGTEVLKELMGVNSGKFTVTSDTRDDSRVLMDEPLEGLIQHSIAHLRKVLAAVSGAQISQVAKVEISPDSIQALIQTSPGEVKEVIQALITGKGPRDLLLGGEVEPQLLEAVLTDLARRGALHSVIGPHGENRLATVLSAGDKPLSSDEVTRIASYNPLAQNEEAVEKFQTSEIEEVVLNEEIEGSDSAAEIRPSRPSNVPFGNTASFPSPILTATGPAVDSRSTTSAGVSCTEDSNTVADNDSSKTLEEALPLEEAKRLFKARKEAETKGDLLPTAKEPDTSFVKYAISMVALLVMGFIGWKVFLDYQTDKTVSKLPEGVFNPPIQLIEQEGNEAVAKKAVEDQENQVKNQANSNSPNQPKSQNSPNPTLVAIPKAPTVLAHEYSFGQTIDGISGAKVKVKEGEGLVSLQLKNMDANTKVFLGDKPLNKPPFQIAMPEGSYEISLQKPQSTQYRYLFVPAGKTRVVTEF